MTCFGRSLSRQWDKKQGHEESDICRTTRAAERKAKLRSLGRDLASLRCDAPTSAFWLSARKPLNPKRHVTTWIYGILQPKADTSSTG